MKVSVAVGFAAVVPSPLGDAGFRGCRWIEGDPMPLRRGMFCGLPVVADESWCAEHRDIVFGGSPEGRG